MKKEVLVIFKTHLDIGFTDYSENVIKKYIETFIPNAIETGYKLKGTKTPFIWTVGSWLIWEGLKYDKDKKLENAIKDGVIAWHGLPFTTHTEAMNEKLLDLGLDISKKLDERFGTKTTGSKMTDVPGHTIGLVNHLVKYGIKFLHIGVNTATPNPDVPPAFRWKSGDDEVIVVYDNGYGGSGLDFGDFVIEFAHTFDNNGAQPPEEIIKLYSELEKKYPDSDIKAATLTDIAERIVKVKNLPVVDKEIGDTWIHGVGTDPKKVGMFREIERYIENKDVSNVDFSDNLLLVPEHTWGMCLQKYYNDVNTWLPEVFNETEGTEMRVAFEKSWEEQRNYVYKAQKLLGIDVDYKIEKPNLEGFVKTNKEPNFELSWQLFDNDDYNRYMKKYLTLCPQNVGWAIWDYLKLGLPDYKGGIFTAEVKNAYEKDDTVIYELAFDEEAKNYYGLPDAFAVVKGEEVTINWMNMKPLRLPNAYWMKFKGFNENFKVSKMGKWIEPDDIIGSPLIMATDNGVCNGEHQIIPLDSALVAPYGRRLLDFEKHPTGKDMYFNLYNNIWNTNFPMWYSDDTRFRFIVK